jgi:hypothetical protein
MTKKVFTFSGVIILAIFLVCSNVHIASAATDTVTLSTSVQEYLTFSITAGDPASLGNLTPGTPICHSTATVASVTTNAANGYTLGLSDGSGTNSALLHTDTSTYISDYAGTVAVPTSWTDTGLGVTMFAADTNKESAWGTGTTVCDSNNKYAGAPESSTTGHTVTGFHSSADTSSWGWKIDVLGSQKTGSYNGSVTFTATAVLS